MTRGGWVALALLVIVVLVVYANSLGGEFCYDENIVILRNDNVQDPGRIWALWADTYWGSAVPDDLDSRGWRPLTIFSYHLNHRLGGDDPFWYHFVNVGLHVLCTALLLVLCLRLRFGLVASTAASALFAVHAVHTEAVSQIVGRAELLAGVCVIGAALLHAHAFPPAGGRPSPARRWSLMAAAALLFLLGLLGKESAVAFLALVVATDVATVLGGAPLRWSSLGRLLVSRFRPWLVYLLPLAVFLALRAALFGRAFPAHDVHFVDNPMVLLHPALRPLGSVLLWGKAVLLLVVPAALSADYGYAQLPVDRFWTSGLFWFGWVALAALAWAAVRFRRSVPAVTWGALVLALAWIPVSNAFFTIHTVFGERVLYLPSVGFCVLAGAAAARAVRARAQWTRVAAWTALALLLLFNAVRTGVRNRDWRNDLALFDATSRVSTRSVRVLNNYGNVLYTRGDLEGAARQYRKALSYFPDYDDARINLASVLIAQGRHDEAREHLEQVLARNPDHPIANDNLRLVVPQTDTDP